jgi:hypothetical protein
MAEALTREQAKARWPNSPSLWPGGSDPAELSTDPARRAAQLRYSASPELWPAERDLDAEYKRLEAKRDEALAMYPASSQLIRSEINSVCNRVTEQIVELDRQITASSTEPPP